MSRLRPGVLAAKQRLAEGHEQLKQRHQEGASGVALCAAIADLRDEVLLGLYEDAAASLGPGEADALHSEVALIAHGGYGRRDVAPFSDVDVMVLRAPGHSPRVTALAERLLCDVFDAGLVLGHSVRTADEACRLSREDATICTSLIESRFLAGSGDLFRAYLDRFRRQIRRRAGSLLPAIERARVEERIKFGETVYLLEPNVKRSRGGLRGLQLLRWAGMVRYGTPEPEQLHAQGVLSAEDLEVLRQATEFLLWLRNEMHFHAGRPVDVLDRVEQLRIAQLRGYQAKAGLLPVELFMRDYFRHTDEVRHVVGRFLEKAQSPRSATLWTMLLGHRLGEGLFAGPTQIIAGQSAVRAMEGSLPGIMHLLDVANLYNKRISPETWDVVRREASRLPENEPVSPEACASFLSLLEHPNRLGKLLRGMHETRLLERFIPGFAHARGLLQFNQYHKYTVDEHCLRAVERAMDWQADPGPLGRVYRAIPRKHTLHLALLIHDLGKGYPEDHSEVGRRIALQTAERLHLDAEEAGLLEFLVHKHLWMNHLAFRRDTGDEQLIVRFAVEVGSPELLQMLFVITAADLAAVGPDAWTSWKAEVLIDLYHRAMQHLAGESPGTSRDEYLQSRRDLVRTWLGPEGSGPWFVRQIETLPVSYLQVTDPHQIAADLRLLARLGPGEVNAQGHYQPESGTVQYTIATTENVTPGIFHKLTGALTSQGLEILSAQINTLADGLVLDRFRVCDPDYSGEPPPERLEQINRALVESLHSEGKAPSFRRVWTLGGSKRPTTAAAQTRVQIDNATSDHYTILDIFTIDRRGLLYTITRALFELGFSVWRAKIGTYLDQVVDVFYVTDQNGQKVEDHARLQESRRRLLEVIAELEREEG